MKIMTWRVWVDVVAVSALWAVALVCLRLDRDRELCTATPPTFLALLVFGSAVSCALCRIGDERRRARRMIGPDDGALRGFPD